MHRGEVRLWSDANTQATEIDGSSADTTSCEHDGGLDGMAVSLQTRKKTRETVKPC